MLISISPRTIRVSTVHLHAEYVSKRKYGAYIELPQMAYQRYITDWSRHPGEYMRKHYRRWKKFFHDLGLKAREPVFVRGWTKTTDWVVAASYEMEKKESVSLGAGTKDLYVSGGASMMTKQVMVSEDGRADTPAWKWVLRRKTPPGVRGKGASPKEPTYFKSDRNTAPNQCIFIHYIDAQSLGIWVRFVLRERHLLRILNSSQKWRPDWSIGLTATMKEPLIQRSISSACQAEEDKGSRQLEVSPSDIINVPF